jgi:DNA-directed RNA polymerase subunit RPC12/RpoP
MIEETPKIDPHLDEGEVKVSLQYNRDNDIRCPKCGSFYVIRRELLEKNSKKFAKLTFEQKLSPGLCASCGYNIYGRPFKRLLELPKPERNAPCPCGSGKKYKKCCLGEAEGKNRGTGNVLTGITVKKEKDNDKTN